MTHKNIQLLVSANIDSEISEDEKKVVLTHLEECLECRQYVKSAELMSKEIREIRDVEVSEYFANRVIHLIEKRDAEVEDWLGVEPLARNAFLALTLVVLLIFAFAGNGSSYTITDDQLLSVTNADSISTQVLIQREEISKNDLLYAVMTK